ncbi:MAG: hypothetical protein ABJC09_02330 [Terriglobia bacterium]
MQDEEKKDAEKTTVAHISISVSPEGDFSYHPSVKRLRHGQSVRWTCEQGPFTIAFRVGTPFDKVHYEAERGESSWAVTTREVHEERRAGHFHYAVALYCLAVERVFLDAACPEIIVN